MGVLKWLFKGAIVALLRSDSATIGVQDKKFGTVKGALWEGGHCLLIVQEALLTAKTPEKVFGNLQNQFLFCNRFLPFCTIFVLYPLEKSSLET